MDLDRILTSVPIDRTAAVVTSGASHADEPLSVEQKRENLRALVKKLEIAIKATKDPERKRWLGLQKLDVQTALNALPRRCVRDRDLSHFIVDVVKERIPRTVFHSIMNEAQRRLLASKQGADGEAAQ